jgi:hypothetical protein
MIGAVESTQRSDSAVPGQLLAQVRRDVESSPMLRRGLKS